MSLPSPDFYCNFCDVCYYTITEHLTDLACARYQKEEADRLAEGLQRANEMFKTYRDNHKKDGQHILDGINKGNDLNWIRAWVSDIANGKGHGGIQS
jgi:hypothetical protein